ncbi:hypothetical protein ACO03_11480 [Pantoea ananatis]|nr:hypothetical protein ACO03_11480 [Pantoea ananatis]
MTPLKGREITQAQFFKICNEYDEGKPKLLSIEGREPSFDRGVIYFTLRKDRGTHFTGIGIMAVSLTQHDGGQIAAETLHELKRWLSLYQESAA